MENQTVLMAAMRLTVCAAKLSSPAGMDLVSLSRINVITSMIVVITAMKRTIVSVTYRMNLSVKAEVASTPRGFVMRHQIVLMEAMRELSVVRLHVVRTDSQALSCENKGTP